MPVMKVGPGRALLYSGVVPWTPALPTIDGGLLPDHWYRSDGPLWQDAGVTPAVLDGAVVGRWEDLTANADHVNQAVVANKPTLQNGAGDLLNGQPVVRIDGANDYLQGAYTTGGAMNQPNTFFVVAALDAAAVNDGMFRFVIGSDDVINRADLRQDPTAAPDTWGMHGGANLASAVASNANWNIWTALFNGAGSQLWHNGVSLVVGNAGANNPDGLVVGVYIGGINTTHWDGDITEIILYDANLSNADKNQVGNYLATRYALAYTDI